ncbi:MULTISPECIES: 5-formyltetrahydrofolate cyclo-ligase [unclassified Arthrobacter]|uniref:5-formyltetrahydrofolate cyclo-ligase n=1 Tax=unclassified Arthrobacter TaxID=235627 RepID=UPI002DFEED5B|nr:MULTISPECIES: 5-formyltetrahydrofolate cyclo-ligase [unclassified Arthrobacter]MEC5190215.1 5-formyltetrahydrofolate cyclo-ligase [Arthrobacter sp. MP_M4]MEC5201683.1 5-formyltetrahydrofolate cyclo-ligase [Arthrobacter sp. MP_M7]
MASKEEIRASHRARRTALAPAEVEAAGMGIARHGLSWAASLTGGRPGTFAAYLGVGTEPPTLPLLGALHAAGHRLLLPVCEPGLALSWVRWTPVSEYVRSRYAPILEPAGERLDTTAMRHADGIFLPATALDFSGNRIGQGGGYYDRFLAALGTLLATRAPAPDGGLLAPLPTAAVVYDSEVLSAGSIPAESFDRKVAAALTPSGLLELRGPASGDLRPGC